MQVTVKGVQELLRKFQDLPRHIRQKELMAATQKAAEPIRAGMEDRAPIDTGLLAASGGIETVKNQSDPDTAIVRVGPERQAFYGYFQEHGTEFMESQEFLGHAFEDKKQETQQILTSELKNAIDKWVQANSE
jgi:HK97 gp10 family phage protein